MGFFGGNNNFFGGKNFGGNSNENANTIMLSKLGFIYDEKLKFFNIVYENKNITTVEKFRERFDVPEKTAEEILKDISEKVKIEIDSTLETSKSSTGSIDHSEIGISIGLGMPTISLAMLEKIYDVTINDVEKETDKIQELVVKLINDIESGNFTMDQILESGIESAISKDKAENKKELTIGKDYLSNVLSKYFIQKLNTKYGKYISFTL